ELHAYAPPPSPPPPPPPQPPRPRLTGPRVPVSAPPSPADQLDVTAGIAELRRLGFEFAPVQLPGPEGYFAAPAGKRLDAFLKAARDRQIGGLVALRGGYGATYLLDSHLSAPLHEPNCV